jgi:hypothetical protein
MLSFWHISLVTAFFLSIGRSLGWQSADRFDPLAHCHGRISLTIGESCWPPFSFLNRSIALCFSSAASPYLFLTCFSKKTVSTLMAHWRHLAASYGNSIEHMKIYNLWHRPQICISYSIEHISHILSWHIGNFLFKLWELNMPCMAALGSLAKELRSLAAGVIATESLLTHTGSIMCSQSPRTNQINQIPDSTKKWRQAIVPTWKRPPYTFAVLKQCD